MNNYIKVGETILQKYFDYYFKHSLDDAEYIPVVKVIIEGIEESMFSANIEKKEIREVKKQLKDFNRRLYTDLWLKHAREDEGENIDQRKEIKSARYYFDYIYKNEEHPL